MRRIIDAILYVVKTGCQWRMLPNEFAPWKTVYDHFRRLRLRGVWERILLALNRLAREKKAVRGRRAISSSTRRVSKQTSKAKGAVSTVARR
jgi:transposase